MDFLANERMLVVVVWFENHLFARRMSVKPLREMQYNFRPLIFFVLSADHLPQTDVSPHMQYHAIIVTVGTPC